jgi:microcystin-dependent protein
MAVTTTFNFTTLNGSDPAGHNSINTLINSIDTRLQALSTGLATASTSPGTLSTGQVLRWDGTSFAGAFVDATSLAINAVTTDKINALAVTTAKIADVSVTTGKVADDAITLGTKTNGNYIATITGTASQITVSGSGVESGAATLSIPSSPVLPGAPTIETANGAWGLQTTNTSRAATIKYVNDAAGAITAGTSFTVGGDISGTTGNATIIPDAITTNKILNGAVTSDKILNNTITLNDLAAALQEFLTPTGGIIPFAGGTAPSGWLLCRGTSGTAVTLAAYPALYNLLTANGTVFPYGGSGTTTYTPDLQGRVPFGLGTNPAVDNLADKDLSASVGDRTPTHTHTVPDHAHSNGDLYTRFLVSSQNVWYGQTGGSESWSNNQNGGLGLANNGFGTFSGGFKVGGSTSGSGTLTSGSSTVPYIVTNYIIKV